MKYLLLLLLVFSVSAAISAEEVVDSGNLEQIVDRAKQKDTIPYKREHMVDSSYIGKLVVVLVVLLSFAALILFVLNKLGIGINLNTKMNTGSRHIDLLEVKRLSTKLTMFYVEVDKKPLILAQSGDTLLVINKNDWGSEIEERN